MAVVMLTLSATLGSTAAAQGVSARGFAVYRQALAAQREAALLAERQPEVVSRSLAMNTVRQFPRRRDLEGYLAERSAEAAAWQERVAAGTARRTAIINPYTGATYTKYYDEQGDWQFSIIERDYAATEKLQEEWKRAYRRSEATLEQLRRDFGSLAASEGIGAAQQSQLAGMLVSAEQRMQQFGKPPPELLPRPVQGEPNSPYPSYRAYDAMTGQMIAIGSSQRDSPRPVADSSPESRELQATLKQFDDALRVLRRKYDVSEQAYRVAIEIWNNRVNPTCDNGHAYRDCACSSGAANKAQMRQVLDGVLALAVERASEYDNLAAQRRAFLQQFRSELSGRQAEPPAIPRPPPIPEARPGVDR